MTNQLLSSKVSVGRHALNQQGLSTLWPHIGMFVLSAAPLPDTSMQPLLMTQQLSKAHISGTNMTWIQSYESHGSKLHRLMFCCHCDMDAIRVS